MIKKELVNRWKTNEGQRLLKEVIGCLEKGNLLNSVNGLGKFSGRWDLRGAQLSELTKKRKLESGGYSLEQSYGSLKIKNALIESVDFSFSDISYSVWELCKISNCLFDETKAKEIHFIACEISNTVFRKTDFSYSFMNENIGKESGAYKNVIFTEANLNECIFCFPIVKNSVFENCNLYATNFDGSRMENCKFIGEVNSPWFRGYSVTAHKSTFGIFNRIDPKKYPNEMKDVDFSKAKLIGVSFSHSIDLSKCIFPNSSDYIYVENLGDLMKQVRATIESEWQGEDRRRGLVLVDTVYYKKDKYDQRHDLIDTFPVPSSDILFDEKFFNLIKAINNQSKN